MSTKSLLPDQCTVLHAQYGAHDCCLCKAREEIAALREALSSSNERLDMVREPLGVNYWVEQKDGHDAHVYANDYALSPAEIVERLNEATAGWTQKSKEIAALREDYKTKCGELAHAHAEYQRLLGEIGKEDA